MTRRIALALAPLVLAGACSVPDNSVLVLGIAPNGKEIDPATGIVDGCEFKASADEFALGIILDTARTTQFTLPLTVQNNLAAGTVELATMEEGVASVVTANSSIRPLRMDVVWECDSNGFSGDQGPLVLPAFDPVVPFCLDKRADTQSFVGFDVVPVTGASIQASGSYGLASATVVPFPMGQAIDETFRIAALAEQCCFETRATNCDGQSTGLACTRLTQIFQALDPTGSSLQVAVQTGPSEDLVRFQAFSLFNGANLCARDRTLCDSSYLEGPSYPMRLRGVMEFMKTDGTFVSSEEYSDTLHFCRNCGFWTGTQRYPYETAHTQCYAGKL